MAGHSAILSIKILTDASKGKKGLDDAGKSVSKFESGVGKLAVPAAAVIGGIAAIGKTALDSASESQQAMGAIDSVFGKSAGKVKEWADQAATSAGLSSTQYGNLASKLGASFKNMGLSTDEAAASTQQMIAMGADLAATFGGTTEEAVSALSAALRGEADPAERYGLALSQTAVNAELAAKGQDKLTGAAKNQARAAAIVAMTTKQASGAVGQFGRESDTAAGSAEIAKAQWANASAELGQVLLPIVAKVTGAFAGLGGWIKQNSQLVQILVGVVGGLAVAILAVNAAMKVVRAASSLIGLATNPIGLIVIAIVAVIAAVVLLWNKCEWFRNAVMAVWNAIKVAALAAWNAIRVAITTIITVVGNVVKVFSATVKAVFVAIRTVAVAVWNGIKAAISAVISVVTNIVKAAGAVIRGVWSGIRTAAITAWNGIKAPVKAVYDWILSLWRGFITTITTLWGKLYGIAAAAWNKIMAPIKTVFEWVVKLWNRFIELITTIFGKLAGIATTAWNRIMAPVKTVYDWIVALWDGLVGAIAAIWGRIASGVSSALAPIKSAIQAIKDIWDSTVGRIESTIGKVKGWIDSVKSGIGNVIDKINPFSKAAPSSAAVVTPRALYGRHAAGLGGPVRMGAGAAVGGGGSTINLTVNGAVDADGTARTIVHVLSGRARRTGPIRLGGVLV